MKRQRKSIYGTGACKDLKKNDTCELLIQDMGIDGAGIGKTKDVTLFVKDAVIGDEVLVKVMKMKKNYGYARLEEIRKPSPFRVQPRCALSRQCGGCQLQALDYRKQLEWKENSVKNNLERIGGFQDAEKVLEPIIGMEEPFCYRNKAQFPVGQDKEGRIVAGFYASRSHRIIPNRKCHLGAEINEDILNIVIGFMEKYRIPPYDEAGGTGLVRHILIRNGFASGEIMVCLILNGKKLPHASELVDELCKFKGMASITLNVNRKKTNVILGEQLIPLWGRDYITDSIGELTFQISPLSFYQVNPVQTEKLYQTALEFAGLTGTETVWDLYCGIGTISLFLARHAGEVIGVEVVPRAVRDARNNAERNKIRNVTFLEGKAEEVLPEYYKKAGDGFAREADQNRNTGSVSVPESGQEGQTSEKNLLHPDVIVVDPPRKGCEEPCLDTIVKMYPKRVVYVSCDSATFARDLKYLCSHGYRLERVRPVDMFPQTVGVECVGRLSSVK